MASVLLSLKEVVMARLIKLVNRRHIRFELGRCFESPLTKLVVQINSDEMCLRLDILYFGLYIGWVS